MKAGAGYDPIRCLSHRLYFNTLLSVAARLISIDSSQFLSQLYFQSYQAHRCYRVLVFNGGRNGYLQCEGRVRFDIIKGEGFHIFRGGFYIFSEKRPQRYGLVIRAFEKHWRVSLRLKSTPAVPIIKANVSIPTLERTMSCV